MKCMELGQVALVGLMALAIMVTAAEATFADPVSGSSGANPSTARIFLGSIPGFPKADVELRLKDQLLEAKAKGRWLPLDPDGTRRLNHYALCVNDIFIGSDLVDSKRRRGVDDDGLVEMGGQVRTSLNALLGLEVRIVDIGDGKPANSQRDATCIIPSLLAGTVRFRHLQ